VIILHQQRYGLSTENVLASESENNSEELRERSSNPNFNHIASQTCWKCIQINSNASRYPSIIQFIMFDEYHRSTFDDVTTDNGGLHFSISWNPRPMSSHRFVRSTPGRLHSYQPPGRSVNLFSRLLIEMMGEPSIPPYPEGALEIIITYYIRRPNTGFVNSNLNKGLKPNIWTYWKAMMSLPFYSFPIIVQFSTSVRVCNKKFIL